MPEAVEEDVEDAEFEVVSDYKREPLDEDEEDGFCDVEEANEGDGGSDFEPLDDVDDDFDMFESDEEGEKDLKEEKVDAVKQECIEKVDIKPKETPKPEKKRPGRPRKIVDSPVKRTEKTAREKRAGGFGILAEEKCGDVVAVVYEEEREMTC